MVARIASFKCVLTAFFLASGLGSPVVAQTAALDELYDELLTAKEQTHEAIADEIRREFQRSGSPAMNLLLRRGGDAMEEGDTQQAIEHFTALVNHAPDFAEGYHSRASAYFAAGLWGPALDDLREVLVLAPRHFGALFGVGNLMEGLDRPEDALDVYRLILEIYPLNQQTLDAVARLEEQLRGQSL